MFIILLLFLFRLFLLLFGFFGLFGLGCRLGFGFCLRFGFEHGGSDLEALKANTGKARLHGESAQLFHVELLGLAKPLVRSSGLVIFALQFSKDGQERQPRTSDFGVHRAQRFWHARNIPLHHDQEPEEYTGSSRIEEVQPGVAQVHPPQRDQIN